MKTKKVKIEFEIVVPVDTKYIAMDEDGRWWPYSKSPKLDQEEFETLWFGEMTGGSDPLHIFPDWRKSKKKVGGTK